MRGSTIALVDDDVPGIVLDPKSIEITEGGSESYHGRACAAADRAGDAGDDDESGNVGSVGGQDSILFHAGRLERAAEKRG